MMTWTPGSLAPSTVFVPASGDDFGATFTESSLGGDTLFFDRVRCAKGAWDIFKIVDP